MALEAISRANKKRNAPRGGPGEAFRLGRRPVGGVRHQEPTTLQMASNLRLGFGAAEVQQAEAVVPADVQFTRPAHEDVMIRTSGAKVRRSGLSFMAETSSRWGL